jgi:hypothetical protein
MKRGTGTMKKIALAGLIVVAASLVAVPSSDADSRRGHHHRPHVHGRVFIGVGPAVWWGPYPYWYYPPPPYVYAPPAVYAPPPVVVPEPQVYIQQAPPAAPPSPSAEQFWYYCQSAQAYYPSVSSCPEAWVKVVPRP